MKLDGFVNGAYTLDSVNADLQRCVNLYPEIIESGSGKGRQRGYLKSTSGLDELIDVGTGPIRLIHEDFDGRTFVVSADEVYVIGAWAAHDFATTDVDASTDKITETGHSYPTGIKGQFTTTGTLPAGISLATDYYVIRTSNDEYRVATSWTNSMIGSSYVNITDTGSGTHTFTPTANAAGYQSQLVGSMATSSGLIRAASTNYTKYSDVQSSTVFVDGNTNKLWDPTLATGDGIGPFQSLNSIISGSPGAATTILWQDGYLIMNDVDNLTQFNVSDFNNYEFSGTSFATSEGNPDNIVGMATVNRNVYVFNEKTTEVYYNSGNPDFPFERVQGGFMEHGCMGEGSISTIQGTICLLGQNNDGDGVVYALSGSNAIRISTHSIEQKIASYASLSSATSYSYQWKGHLFYVLNFAEATWVYDFTTKVWHERAYTNAGTLERHLTDNHNYNKYLNVHLMGHYNDGKVFTFNDSTYDDDGDAITRLRVTPHYSDQLQQVVCDNLQLDMETGVGLISGQGSDPQVMLDWSDDGGHTWSDESWTSAGGQSGGIGEYSTRVRWRRLGKFRDRVWRFKVTDPVSVTFIDAFMKLRMGGH